MSSKKLGGLDRKLGSKKLNIGGDSGKYINLQRAALGDPSAMFSRDVLDMRAGESGTRSVEQEERLAIDAAAQAERDRLKEIQDEAARKQGEIDAQNAKDEEARKKLREAQGGGYTANILAGSKGFGYGGSARRRLSGS